MYHNIPLELREYAQWVCWRYEIVNNRRTKVPYHPSGQFRANINNPATWGSFDAACQTALGPVMDGIGFVLTSNDPYTGIDIDDKQENPASDGELQTHQWLLNNFASFTERSVGNRWTDAQGRERGGYHIIIRGKIPGGRDRGHVGVYSTHRYLTFSGDVVRAAPIVDYQQLLEDLVEAMPDNSAEYELLDMEQTMTDREVFDMAISAYNGEKYDRLCRGAVTYRDDGDPNGEYQSRSEADLAIISIIAYYTRNDEQVRRLFRMTALGKRDKHQGSNKWIDRCLRIFRSKQAPPADVEAAKANAMAIIAAAGTAEQQEVSTVLASLPAPTAPPPPAAPPAPTQVAPAPPARAVGPYTPPPGLVGELAAYFYSTSIRPVPEAALCAAISVMAGVAGRAYNISNTGLNQYTLFVAETGRGKDGLTSGISKLMAATRQIVPMAEDFMGPSAFASGQGLVRILDTRPSFVSVLGEFGLTLQAMADPRAPAATVLLRRVLLDLYMKSGWQEVLRPTAYSDTEKNTKLVHAPNVTILGECTPGTLFDKLSAQDIADGLVPRFNVVEYTGARVRRNRQAGHMPPQELVQKFADVMTVAVTSKQNMTCSAVQMTPEALELCDAFDEECDNHINGTAVGSVETELWNRGHLKLLKLAGLIAVGVNPHNPVVTLEIAQWAEGFVRAGTMGILKRFATGDVGMGEGKQTSDMRKMVQDYFKSDKRTLAGYKVKDGLQQAGMIPYCYFTVRAARMAAFYNDRNGTARALKAQLDTLVASEVLGLLSPQEAWEKYQSRQALYYVGASF